MGTIGKGLSFVLVLATVLQLSVSSFAGTVKSDKASTIRLKKTEGTVTVENSSKGEIVQTPDMRLNDGDHELTDITSYAWMNLDDSKLIKLDEESESEVRKKGKKLEVLLDSGSLFFNVTEPLKDDETFNIRTSTMVAGIRGTCGWVRILDGLTTRVYLLEGRLECLVVNPVEGSSETITLKGGQYADFCVYDPNNPGKKCDILTDDFTREDIEPYVLIELVGDDATIDKIYKDSGIDLRDLTREEALSKLEEAQKITALKKAQRDAEEEQKQTSTNNYFEDALNIDDSVVYLTMPQTATTVQKYLENSGVSKVVLLPGDGDNTLWVDIDFTVPAGKTLETRSEVPVDVIKGSSMTVDGTADLGDALGNSGTVTVNSSNTLKVFGLFTNSGLLNNTATGRIVLAKGIYSSGDFINGGRIEAQPGETISQLITLTGGSFTITGGSIVADNCETLIKLSAGSDVRISLSGGIISNEMIGGEALNVKEGSFKLDSLGTDINGVTDSLLGANVNYEEYGSGSVWRTDGRYHLVLLEEVESYPVAVVGNIEHGRLSVPSRVEVGARVPIGVYPDEGYELDFIAVTQNGRAVGVSPDHSFTMPAGNVFVTGGFKKAADEEKEESKEESKEEKKEEASSASSSTGTTTDTTTATTESTPTTNGATGNYKLGANWFKDGGNVKFKVGDKYVTSANKGDVVLIEATPKTGYSLTLQPEDNYDEKMGGSKITFFYDSGKSMFYFDMPDRNAEDIEVTFTYSGNTNYNINLVTTPAATTSSLIGVSTDKNFASPSSVTSSKPGTRINVGNVIRGYSVKSVSVTAGGSSVPLYEDASAVYVYKYFFMPEGNATVNAVLEPAKYAVNLNLNAGGDTSAKINSGNITSGSYGTAVTLPTNVTRNGYSFEGWYISATPSANDTAVTTISAANMNDVTYYAKWSSGTTLTMPKSVTDIQTALDTSGVSKVTLRPGTGNNILTVSSKLTIPAGKTLTIEDGVTVKIEGSGAIVNLSGNTLENNGLIYVGVSSGIENGDSSNPGRILNNGYLFIGATGAINKGNNASTAENKGTIYYTDSLPSWITGSGETKKAVAMGTESSGCAVYVFTEPNAGSNSYNLDIYGFGELGNYNYYDSAPWFIGDTNRRRTVQATIHEGITKVGDYCFATNDSTNNKINTINIPSTLKEIGSYAFYGLKNLKNLNIPGSVTNIGVYAFCADSSLASISLPAGYSGNTKDLFNGCTGLTSFTFPSGITKIDERMFYGCEKLTSIEIPDTVTEIGSKAFSGCQSVSTLVIGNGVQKIGDEAFEQCGLKGSIGEVIIPAGVSEIGYDPFNALFCDSFVIKMNVSEITANIIPTGAKSVVLPEGATSIEAYCFSSCSSLESVRIPVSLTSVGDGAFQYCSALNTVYYNGTVSQWNLLNDDTKANIKTNGITVHCTDGDV